MISEKEIVESIIELLGQNKFLTIPGFGTLEVEIISAYTYRKEILFPPSRKLSTFDSRKIKNDKILIGYLMRKFQLDPASVNRTLKLITSDWKSQLNNGVLTLDKIGKFEKGKNNRILFSPVKDTLETAIHFGLPEKISKIDLTGNKISEVLESSESKELNDSVQSSDDSSIKIPKTKDSQGDTTKLVTAQITPKEVKNNIESSQRNTTKPVTTQITPKEVKTNIESSQKDTTKPVTTQITPKEVKKNIKSSQKDTTKPVTAQTTSKEVKKNIESSRRDATKSVTKQITSKKVKKNIESSQSKVVKDVNSSNQNEPKHKTQESSTSNRKQTVRQENIRSSDSIAKKNIKPGVSYYPRRKPPKKRPVVVYLLILCIVIALIAPYIAVNLLGYEVSIEKKPLDTREIVPITPLVESNLSEDNQSETIESSLEEDTQVSLETSETQIKAEASIYYVVIAGSFESEGKANEYIDELRNSGFPARLSTNRSLGRYRVIYDGFDSLDGALIGLREIRNTIDKDAWLLREK